MSVGTSLDVDQSPDQLTSKIPVPVRNIQTHAGNSKVPPSEVETLDSLRWKVEHSVDALVRARRELEEILPVEGSSEQGLSGCPVDLRTELRRHRELTSKVASKGSGTPEQRPPATGSGPVAMGGSYRFLTSIMGRTND